MNAEMARMILYVSIVLNWVFTLFAAFNVLLVLEKDRDLEGIQKFFFWFAAPLTLVSLVWVVLMTEMVIFPYLRTNVPQFVPVFLIYAFPAAALAAGTTLGTFVETKSTKEDEENSH